MRPFRSKYRHLFEGDTTLSTVSKVEIEYTLRKQLEFERTSDISRSSASAEGSPFSAGRGGTGVLRRDSLGIASNAGYGQDGEKTTPLLLDKLTARLSHYS